MVEDLFDALDDFDESLSVADIQDMTDRLRNKMLYAGLTEEDIFPEDDPEVDIDLDRLGL